MLHCKKSTAKDLINDVYTIFYDFLYKNIILCWGYSSELHRQVDAIQMGTHNTCLYKEVDKKLHSL